MSRKDLLRAGPPCPRECANREPLREAAEGALGCGGVGCVKVRRVGGPGSGARGLFRVEMTWAAPGGGGARGLPRAGTARAVPGGGGVGCTGSRPGKARAGPPLFIPGRAFSKASARYCGRRFLHRGSRFLKRLPPQPAFFIPEPTSPKRAAALFPAPERKCRAKKPAAFLRRSFPHRPLSPGPTPAGLRLPWDKTIKKQGRE